MRGRNIDERRRRMAFKVGFWGRRRNVFGSFHFYLKFLGIGGLIFTIVENSIGFDFHHRGK